MLQILSILVSIGAIICFIIVLIKLFQEKGALHGILGILSCGLYPLIWGWIHAGRLNIKNVMLAWTILIIANLVLSAMGASAMTNNLLRQQQQPQTAPVITTP